MPDAATILVIDHDRDVAQGVSRRLRKAGYEVMVSENGRDGVRRALAERPHVILLDPRVPLVGGRTVLALLREHPATAKLPLVLFSTEGRAHVARARREAGVGRYLSKPYDAHRLLGAVRDALRLSPADEVRPSSPSPTTKEVRTKRRFDSNAEHPHVPLTLPSPGGRGVGGAGARGGRKRGTGATTSRRASLDRRHDTDLKLSRTKIPTEKPMTSTKKILLVDDEEEILRGANLWLSAAGYETSTARNGMEAVATATEDQPDVIVMDVRMPHKDGLTALAELQQQPHTRHIPIVMLSACLIDKEKALDAGARFFLTKPYEGRKLVEAVNAMTGRAEHSARTRRRVAPRHGPARASAPDR
jgi:DNA-binding response OmpR family regulator